MLLRPPARLNLRQSRSRQAPTIADQEYQFPRQGALVHRERHAHLVLGREAGILEEEGAVGQRREPQGSAARSDERELTVVEPDLRALVAACHPGPEQRVDPYYGPCARRRALPPPSRCRHPRAGRGPVSAGKGLPARGGTSRAWWCPTRDRRW